MKQILLQWDLANWSRHTLIKSSELDNDYVVSAIMWIIKSPEWYVYLTRNKRWWDLPWGHVDPGEHYMDSLYREFEEEAWSKISWTVKLWWYNAYDSDEPLSNWHGGFYPIKSCIPFYIWKSTWEEFKPYWEEVIESCRLPIQEVIEMVSSEVDRTVLKNILEMWLLFEN